MKLFDSHCHLDDHLYDNDQKDVISKAIAAGVSGMMVVGVSHKSSVKAVSLAEKFPGLFASVGIHPHDAKDCNNNVIDRLEMLAESHKVKAWGEIGLDFNRMFSSKAVQEKWFIKQLESATGLNYPVIFHERDSKGRFLEILKANAGGNISGVVHCFSGNRSELLAYLSMGLHIGITGIVTIKGRGAALRKLVPEIPAERILIETDAPYLTPAPEKNSFRRNEPAFVKSVLLKLAKIRGADRDELASIIFDNTCRLYNINGL